MFNDILKSKFEYFTKYFEAALKNNKRGFPQSIVLYGQDSIAQYYLAVDIARQLNCLKDGSQNCDCINCNWIKNNQHPAILTISKNDNKPSDDTSSKVISIKQTLAINNSLISSSDYYRVFILCDSEINEYSETTKKQLAKFSQLNYKFPQENWYPQPLNREVLIEASANSMLKSIEEPPEKTLFIFLTQDKEDIIETIISRSQCFYVPSFDNNAYDTEFLYPILADYPNLQKINIISLVSTLQETAEIKGYSLEYILNALEYYFAQLLKNNITNKTLVHKIKKDILRLQNSKKQLRSYIKPQLILEDLFFGLC